MMIAILLFLVASLQLTSVVLHSFYKNASLEFGEKLRTRSRLKSCREHIFGQRCISFPLTYGHEMSFPTLDTVLTMSVSNCL